MEKKEEQEKKELQKKKSVFINPFVDRGFKILFGQESSKELLIRVSSSLYQF